MKLVDDVFEIAESFMKNPQHVSIDYKMIEYAANDMTKTGKITFPIPQEKNYLKGIVLDLVSASVNYCYWYGRYNIRPGGASSTLMYELLMECFLKFKPNDKEFIKCIKKFEKMLALYRFPLLEERVKHLKELYGSETLEYCNFIENKYHANIGNTDNDMNYFFKDLIIRFPGFASDIFLKRASLFFIQLHRRFGWFDGELHHLHVPADYQIPKMLEHLKCIKYNDTLKQTINTNQLIPKNSIQECEIRAATIITIKKLCKLTNWNVADVDGFLFIKRHETTNPFHLCITTDY